ncbi:AAA family ATPase [Cedecea davisae]|uniref:AAA family ATPase n=1 Tax=Cedecea davisae TaxID=158484 RepID=UPI00376F067F
MSFRLEHVSFYGRSEFEAKSVSFTSRELFSSVNENYYTVVIGNNGIGKSRLLGNIVRLFYYIKRGRVPRDFPYFSCRYDFNGSGFEINRIEGMRWDSDFYSSLPGPERIFAITNSISDTFPNDVSMFSPLFRQDGDVINYHKEDYLYFGARGRANNTSSYALVNKCFDVFFDSKITKIHQSKFIHLFSFLEYSPSFEVIFPLRNPYYEKGRSGDVLEAIKSELERVERRLASGRSNYSNESSLKRIKETLANLDKEDIGELNSLYIDAINNEGGEVKIKIDFRGTLKEISSQQRKYKMIGILIDAGLLHKRIISFTKNNGSTFSFQKASSGEAGLIAMFMGLIPVLKNNSLIVIDEPELSLHPSWQFKYIELLDSILSELKSCHVIIASHSHFILSDIPAERSCVITLKEGEEGCIYSEEIDENTYGASAENILLNVFKLPTTRNYYLSSMVTKALELVATGQKKSDEFNIVLNKISEIRVNLRDEDPLSKVIENLLSIR